MSIAFAASPLQTDGVSKALLFAVLALVLGAARHAVGQSPLLTVPMVTVGNPNNAAASATNTTYPSSYSGAYGYGSVSYAYQIGTTEVTVSQYATFLNAVAASDPYGLYNTNMGTDLNIAGITRSGSSGNYSYTPLSGTGNLPIAYTSFFDAARFVNWLQNGAQQNGNTESGTYTMSTGNISAVDVANNVVTVTTSAVPASLSIGDQVSIAGTTVDNGATGYVSAKTATTFSFAMSGSDQNVTTGGTFTAVSASRNQGSTFFIHNQNEWYKAAFYDPTLVVNSTAGGYYLYQTKSNDAPFSINAPGTGSPANGNAANYYYGSSSNVGYNNGYAVTSSATGNSDQLYLTPAGGYTNSASYYGTFDQGGNLIEWMEDSTSSYRYLRSGSWSIGIGALAADNQGATGPSGEYNNVGFRIAAVPEPNASALVAVGVGFLFFVVLRRRRGVTRSREGAKGF